jgi:hypothetical protein
MTGVRGTDQLFMYLVLDRPRANLALARHQLRRIEADLAVLPGDIWPGIGREHEAPPARGSV